MRKLRILVLLLALIFPGLIAPGLAAPASADETIDVEVEIPEPPAKPSDHSLVISNAELRWGINVETNSGAFFGGCNWVQAGEAGNWGRSEVWTDARFWKSRDGNVRIEKPDANGNMVEPTWENKCQDLSGSQPRNVTTLETHESGQGTKAEVVITGGTGKYDADTDTLRIEWQGSFTVVFYGGMTYWWARNPVLEIRNGVGTLTADLGGYGADMHDSSRWEVLPVHKNVPLAQLSGVKLVRDHNGRLTGFQHRPDYEGVKVNAAASGPSQPQNRTEPGWGAFPQEFIDFQVLTGQAGYWYTSGGIRDRAKPPHDIIVSFDASNPLDAERPDVAGPPPSSGTQQQPGLPTQPQPPDQPGQRVAPQNLGVAGAGVTTVLPNTYEPVDLSALIAAIRGEAEGEDVWYAGHTPEAQDIEWLGGGLIPPAVADFVRDHQKTFWWALAGLLVLGGITIYAYRRGWLTVPWA
ncbi:hypothetical protein [Trueperella bialowiezensis]|uniref:Htaa n=1 Tax=Trueperella bialowiezensis TaxID=312285 RepID=A0A3S5EW25_9ACTO|nr:hypothetical protein [Trueperella bialowiezensis]VEI13319.1 Uncharacterised protein [Trueperella bialowiezensis]